MNFETHFRYYFRNPNFRIIRIFTPLSVQNYSTYTAFQFFNYLAQKLFSYLAVRLFKDRVLLLGHRVNWSLIVLDLLAQKSRNREVNKSESLLTRRRLNIEEYMRVIRYVHTIIDRLSVITIVCYQCAVSQVQLADVIKGGGRGQVMIFQSLVGRRHCANARSLIA